MFVADTGPLLCHGTLKNGARRFRAAIGALYHVSAVRSELECRATSQSGSKHLRDAAAAWTGTHVGRLGTHHDLSASGASVTRVKAALSQWDTQKGKVGRHQSANDGEAEAIVAALELNALLIANDNGARAVAAAEGVQAVWTTVDVLISEVAMGAATEDSAFQDYQRMRQRNTDPGDVVRGPLDLIPRRAGSS